jgi:phage-related protein
MNLDAVLKVRADVQGQGEIDGLSKSLGNLNRQADGVKGGLGRMGQAAQGIGGLMSSLLPAAAIGGIAALGKRAIDTADDLNDMSQRTGVAVESLSRFGQAAADSGSSVEGVAKGMGQLAKRITDPGSAASKALAGIGIATTDAQGKVRGLDAVMLDISDKFAKMPDGAEKSALAMQLFGKSGVELIPMLNEGRAALEQYQATISGDMAASADQFNDALNAIGRNLSGPFNEAVTALLPAITAIANGLVTVIQAFSNLPGPVQAAILVIGGALAALLALAPAISALITIGTTIAGLFAAGGALASAGTIIAGLATAFAVLITGPVGIVALIVAAGVAIYAFRDQIGAAFKAVVDFIGNAFNAIGNLLKAGAKAYMDYYVKPILGFFKGLYDGAVDIFKKIGGAIGAAFKTVVDTIKAVFRSVLQYLASRVNAVTGLINVLIAAFNRLPAPDIPLIPKLTVPEFAQGGVVSRPTLAMVGEGGEREYIVPESKMAAASANYLAGARGGNVLAGATAGGTPVINVTTGPVMEFNGERYVTVADMERAMRATANSVIGRLRTPSARIALGMA